MNSSPIFSEVSTFDVIDYGHPTLQERRIITELDPYSSELKALRFRPLIKCTVNLPIKNQYDVHIMQSINGEAQIDATSIFKLFYDGCIFGIYREIDIKKVVHPGIVNIRDLFQEALLDKRWKLEKIPPNPLRQDFIFYFVDDTKVAPKNFGKTFERDKGTIVMILPVPKDDDFDKVLGRLLYTNSLILDVYYQAMSDVKSLNDISSSIIELQDSIQLTIKAKSILNYFDLLRHYKSSKKLEKLIFEHYGLILKYTNDLNRLRTNIGRIEEYLAANELFSIKKKDLIDDLQPDTIDVETLSKCIEYARSMSEKSYIVKMTILGALLGIAGGIAGSLVLEIIQRLLFP